jgi:hypothetical protein
MIRRELPQSRRVDHPMVQMPEAGSVEGSPFEAGTLGRSLSLPQAVTPFSL